VGLQLATLILSSILMLVITISVTLWMAGALYFDVARSGKWARPLAFGWIAGVVTILLVVQPLWHAWLVVLSIFVLFLCWWLSQRPSHDREWEPNSAVLPRVSRDGDAVKIENVRNTTYRDETDYTPSYDTRTYHLSKLRAVDCLLFYWGSPWMSHPILVFDFGEVGRVCVSIEVRYRVGQEYNVLRSLYRQQELIYVVADERDVILRRTQYAEGNDGYLYQLQADLEEMRTVFLDYVEVINGLHERPRWYHGLCANCTTSIYRQRHSRVPCDWRILINGRLDQSLYDRGRLDRSLPFETLRQKSRINEIANRAPMEGFGDYLRRELERQRND
jgi:hypothetical protein